MREAGGGRGRASRMYIARHGQRQRQQGGSYIYEPTNTHTHTHAEGGGGCDADPRLPPLKEMRPVTMAGDGAHRNSHATRPSLSPSTRARPPLSLLRQLASSVLVYMVLRSSRAAPTLPTSAASSSAVRPCPSGSCTYVFHSLAVPEEVKTPSLVCKSREAGAAAAAAAAKPSLHAVRMWAPALSMPFTARAGHPQWRDCCQRCS